MKTGFVKILISLPLLLGTTAVVNAQTDHSQHAGHHQMTAEQLAELRSKIQLYDQYSDEQIMAGMARMKNLWGWVGDTPKNGRVGVLALAHGFKEKGNQQFTTAFEAVGEQYPTTYAFGMAMMTSEHIQAAVTSLEEAGAQTIIILPTTTADHSTLTHQWDYIFGLEEESAYLDVPRVQTQARLIWTETPTAHPIMAEIMLDYARELSRDPANELVIIMGHGPQSAEDNDKELAILSRHADYIAREGGFMDVKFANVQDDAPTAVRARNAAMIRAWAQDAQDQGRDVVVVTTALTQSGALARMQRDVEGVARFNDKGLMQNPRFGAWIDSVIETRVADAN